MAHGMECPPASAGVLVVDGNPALLQTLAAVFADTPHACVTATDTVTALCLIVEHQPHTVIVDADTGPLELWQFCALIRGHPDYRAIRLVVSCNRDDLLARAQAAAVEAAAFLAKPFATEDVLRLLGERDGEGAPCTH